MEAILGESWKRMRMRCDSNCGTAQTKVGSARAAHIEKSFVQYINNFVNIPQTRRKDKGGGF